MPGQNFVQRLLRPRFASLGTLNATFDRRAMVLGSVQGGIGVLLAVRMGWIAIFQNRKYELESESNRVNLTLIPPRRGWILDRHGAPLASNRTDFRVDVIADRMVDKDRTVAELGKLLQLTAIELQDLKDRLDKAHGFQPVEAASGLDWERFAAVSVRLPDLPGVVPQRGFSRLYPTGPSVGHLVGYVGAASAEVWEGAGFVFLKDEPKHPTMVAQCWNADVILKDASSDIKDTLGPATAEGRFTATYAPDKVEALLAKLSRKTGEKLGYPRLVRAEPTPR